MRTPWWVGFSYLVYLIAWNGMVWAGAFYLVTEKDWGVGTLVFAVFLSVSSYRPARWHGIFTGKDVEDVNG